jgi:hypothetical protein
MEDTQSERVTTELGAKEKAMDSGHSNPASNKHFQDSKANKQRKKKKHKRQLRASHTNG